MFFISLGFAPIPVDNSFPTVPRNSKPDLAGIPEPTKPVSTSGAPTAHQQQVPFGPTMVSPSAATSLPSKATQVSNKPAQKAPQSLHEKQLAAILERQKLFKVAALEAKKRNDLQAAKEYLRLAKVKKLYFKS